MSYRHDPKHCDHPLWKELRKQPGQYLLRSKGDRSSLRQLITIRSEWEKEVPKGKMFCHLQASAKNPEAVHIRAPG
jgi:hypothetical protein